MFKNTGDCWSVLEDAEKWVRAKCKMHICKSGTKKRKNMLKENLRIN